MNGMNKQDVELVVGLVLAFVGVSMMIGIGIVFLDALFFMEDSIGSALSLMPKK